MTVLLEIKEKMKQIYADYSMFLLPVFKFALAMLVFKGINSSLPIVKELDSMFVLLLLSLICSIMPLNVTVIFGVLLLIGQCYGIGMEVAGFAVALILILLILYIRFTPKDALVLLLTPIAFGLKIPCVIPIGYGLTRTPASAISSGCGVIVYYFIKLVSEKASILQGGEKRRDCPESEVYAGRSDEKSGYDDEYYRLCSSTASGEWNSEAVCGLCVVYCYFYRRNFLYCDHGGRRTLS